jgi:hypothetical protein
VERRRWPVKKAACIRAGLSLFTLEGAVPGSDQGPDPDR